MLPDPIFIRVSKVAFSLARYQPLLERGEKTPEKESVDGITSNYFQFSIFSRFSPCSTIRRLVLSLAFDEKVSNFKKYNYMTSRWGNLVYFPRSCISVWMIEGIGICLRQVI